MDVVVSGGHAMALTSWMIWERRELGVEVSLVGVLCGEGGGACPWRNTCCVWCRLWW